MTGRERFLRTMSYQSVDRVPLFEIGPWGQTIDRWEKEGLPVGADQSEGSWSQGSEYFGFDRCDWVNIRCDMYPKFNEEVIEEDSRYIVKRNNFGVLRKALKPGTSHGTRASMDTYMGFPVTNRNDFEEMKRRYDPSSHVRYPQWWDDRIRCLKGRDFPAIIPGIGMIGFYSRIREWMGTEAACTIFYDDPGLAHHMLDFLADFIEQVLRNIFKDYDDFDAFMWWEDYAYKTAPLISPAIFKEFLFPRYRRINDLLQDHGVNIVIQDSDGNCEVLIPQHLEVGINVTFPLEAAADMDPVRLRKKFGKDLLLWGGIDKRKLAKGKKEIEDELLYKLPPLLEEGGYIPTVDHTVPADVSWENWQYYVDFKRKIIEGRHGT